MKKYTDAELTGNVIFTAVNGNAEIGENIPSKKYLDLQLLFYINLGSGDDTHFCLVTDEMLDELNRTVDDIYEIATQNSVYRLTNLDELRGEPSDMDSFVAMNDRAMEAWGGLADSIIADPHALAGFARKMNRDLYLVPSSIHEILLVPTDTINKEDLKQIIRMVNDDQVKESERLSYNLYEFDRDTEEIRIV